MTKDYYLLRFRANDRMYGADIARKKNADIRKVVTGDGRADRVAAMEAAWAEYYGEKK